MVGSLWGGRRGNVSSNKSILEYIQKGVPAVETDMIAEKRRYSTSAVMDITVSGRASNEFVYGYSYRGSFDGIFSGGASRDQRLIISEDEKVY
jgi:hypothetical protein